MNELVFNQQLGLCIIIITIIIVRAAGKREETETIFNNLMTDSLSLTNSQTLSSSVRYGEREGG